DPPAKGITCRSAKSRNSTLTRRKGPALMSWWPTLEWPDGREFEIAPEAAMRFEHDARRHVWFPSRVALVRQAKSETRADGSAIARASSLGGHHDINARPFRSRHVNRLLSQPIGRSRRRRSLT